MQARQENALRTKAQRIPDARHPMRSAQAPLDLARPFLPESLARTASEPLLSPEGRLLLNQIRGHAYLAVFGLLEEFILPCVLTHLERGSAADAGRTRALVALAGKEARHVALFKRLRASFAGSFATACEAIGPADAVRREVLAHPPLSVALAMLHTGLMVQQHYADNLEELPGLERRFRALLRQHAAEKARHLELECALVDALATRLDRAERLAAVDGYLDIATFFDEGLRQQAVFDLLGLERALGRSLPEGERRVLLMRQHQASRWTFLGSGMSHERMLAVLDSLDPEARARVERVLPLFC